MSDVESVERLSFFATSIGLIFVVIGLLNGFGLVYMLMTKGSIPGMMVSAHSHFLCMSTIILVAGLAMRNWAREIDRTKTALKRSHLGSAKSSVALLVIGNMVAFIFYSANTPKPGLIGDILYFIGFLIVAVGWIIGGRRMYFS